ncbi:cytochrome C oxidase subunit IV family protein [Candidatus Thalassarchaeum betae]|uniref:cytochrome C oxidase subunit IV family protein n=1 Tax=Candidatus Thalassarchaeum betae TaxID=2599289 RepID=UPI0030C75D6F|nr:cytochrome C oxidase subunit IV family protein [Candidatus Thalassoarchaea betae]
MSNTIFGKDAYWMNFFGLMILTAIEVGAVGSDLSRDTTLTVLSVVAVPKLLMIAAIFMHLWGSEDSRILTLTALFPAFFIIVMVLFIGLTHPDGATGLPAWCRPGTYGL